MGTQADFDITPRLYIRRCLNGNGLTNGGVVELIGITEHEFDYVEELTVEQARELCRQLQLAISVHEEKP